MQRINHFVQVAIPVCLLCCGCGTTKNNSLSPATNNLGGSTVSTTVPVSASSVPTKNYFEKAPVIDTSTPDKTVKSYWACLDPNLKYPPLSPDLEESARAKAQEAQKVQAVFEQQRLDFYKRLTERPLLSEYEPSKPEKPRREEVTKPIISREITDVQVQTPTRALVYVKQTNITPIPPDFKLTEMQQAERDKGATYRYVLEKSSNGWRIENIQENNSYGDGEWQNKYGPKPDQPDYWDEYGYVVYTRAGDAG